MGEGGFFLYKAQTQEGHSLWTVPPRLTSMMGSLPTPAARCSSANVRGPKSQGVREWIWEKAFGSCLQAKQCSPPKDTCIRNPTPGNTLCYTARGPTVQMN